MFESLGVGGGKVFEFLLLFSFFGEIRKVLEVKKEEFGVFFFSYGFLNLGFVDLFFLGFYLGGLELKVFDVFKVFLIFRVF